MTNQQQAQQGTSGERNFARVAAQAAREDRPPVVGYSVLCSTKATETTNKRGRVGVVLVKFFFPEHSALVPNNIPSVDQQTVYKMEEECQDEAIKLGLPVEDAAPGRYREGKSDTGILTIKQQGKIVLDFDGLVAGLKSAGLNLVRIERWNQDGKMKGKPVVKTVVCAAFERAEVKSALAAAMVPMMADIIQRMSRMTWGYVNVWDNPDRVTTLNFDVLGHAQDKPKHIIKMEGKEKIVIADYP